MIDIHLCVFVLLAVLIATNALIGFYNHYSHLNHPGTYPLLVMVRNVLILRNLLVIWLLIILIYQVIPSLFLVVRLSLKNFSNLVVPISSFCLPIDAMKLLALFNLKLWPLAVYLLLLIAHAQEWDGYAIFLA